MNKNNLNHYVTKLLNSIEKNLNVFYRNKKPQSLHLLRVKIKKLKAIYSFAEKTYKEEYNSGILKQLFQKAGKIREIHINMHLLGLLPEVSDKTLATLKKKETILTGQFIANGELYTKLLNKFRDENCLPKKLPLKKIIKKYFKKERQKANKLHKNNDRESIHRYRIKIKKIMYIYDALPEKKQKSIQLNTDKINKQQKKLGSWHDTYAAINFLSHENLYKKESPVITILNTRENRQFNAIALKSS